MPRRNLFLLRFNGRNDNLGDQFIFRELVEALSRIGFVSIRGKAPAFVPHAAAPQSDWSLGVLVLQMRVRGCSVYSFSPPGGRLWTDSKRISKSPLRRIRSKLFDWLAGRRIAIGTSVISAADHFWCQYYEWIGVRDQASLKALRDAGVKQADYFPDLAFLSPSQFCSDAPRATVAFSFRQFVPEVRDGKSYEHRLSNAISVLARSSTADVTRHAEMYHQVEEDAQFNDWLSGVIGIPRYDHQLAISSFRSYYQSAKVVVSNRLHCLILGALCGAVPVALTSRDHSKLISLFESVGWKSLILFIEDADGLEASFESIQRNLPKLQAMVIDTCDQQRRLGLRILEQRFGDSEVVLSMD